MREIYVSSGEILIFDEEDYEKLKDYQWHKRSTGKHAPFYTLIDGRAKSLKKMMFGEKCRDIIIPQNGDPYDFRRENLIRMDYQLYQHLHAFTNEQSKYRGVSRRKSGKSQKWAAKIYGDDRYRSTICNTEVEAAVAYNLMACKLYGENAFQNVIEEPLPEALYEKLVYKVSRSFEQRRSCVRHNTEKNEVKTSRFQGVFWRKDREIWGARIAKDKQSYFLGHFDDEVDAALAYNEKALELYGKHAYLNEV